MDSSITPEHLDMIIQGLNTVQLARLMHISAVTIALYDHVIAFADESQLIWRKRWSLGKVLFLIIRYQNIAIVVFEIVASFNNYPSQKLCYTSVQWQFCTLMSTFIWTEVLMQIRIYAMYGCSKTILGVMLPLFAVNIVTTGVLVGKVLLNHGLAGTLTPTLSSCGIEGDLTYTFWFLPIVCFETILLILALYKGIEHFGFLAKIHDALRKRKRRSVGGVIGRPDAGGQPSAKHHSVKWKGRTAIDVLVRDSLLYYGFIFLLYLIQSFFFFFDKPLIEGPLEWVYLLPAVFSCRLLLNIRRVFDATTRQSVGTGMPFSTFECNHSGNSGSTVGSRTSWTGGNFDHTATDYGHSEESWDMDHGHSFDDAHVDEGGTSNVSQRWISFGWLATEAGGNRVPTRPSRTISS